MGIDELLCLIARDRDAEVKPPAGLPKTAPPHCLPGDLREFYGLCDGLILAARSNHPFRVLAHHEVRSANLILAGEPSLGDRSDEWYAIAETDPSELVGIDLSSSRRGRCFDCHFDTYGLVGQMPVIADSFTQLLHRAYVHRGRPYFWLDPGFVAAADAYG